MKSLKILKTQKNKQIVITTSWDDFSQYDVQLAALLSEYHIPAIFYIPYRELLSKKNLDFAKLLLKDFDIGSHTINHPSNLKNVKNGDLVDEVAGSKSLLEEALECKITSFCYPRGRYNDTVKQAVNDAGYLKARTTEVGNIDLICDPYAIKTTVHAYSGRKEYHGQGWVEYALARLDSVLAIGGYFHLWGHSAEIEKHGEWVNLEWFFSYLAKEIKKH